MTALRDYFEYDFLAKNFPGYQLNFFDVKKHFLVYCNEKTIYAKDTESFDKLLKQRISEVFECRNADSFYVTERCASPHMSSKDSGNTTSMIKSCIPLNRKDGDTFLSPIYLEWIDSGSYHGWQDIDEADTVEPYLCRSFSFLVKEDEHMLVITQTETYGLGKGFKKMVDGFMCIPKCAVLKEIRYGISATEDEGHAD